MRRMEMRRAKAILPMDWVALGYLGVVVVLVLGFRSRISGWPLLAAAHLALGLLILLLIQLHRRHQWGWMECPRLWYPMLLIPAIFKLNGILVPQVNPRDLDMELLSWDRAIFGDHPAAYLTWLEAPWVTDVLRLCWMSYFILPFVVAVPFYLKRFCQVRERGPFLELVLALSTGWYVSYLGYFLTPAIGPGYYSGQVGAPPVFSGGTTTVMLDTLFHLEGTRVRDICPSGHVIIAVLATWSAFRYRLVFRWLLVPVVLGLVLGTVYLRYHYGVDVLAGLAISVAVILVIPRIHTRMMEDDHEP